MIFFAFCKCEGWVLDTHRVVDMMRNTLSQEDQSGGRQQHGWVFIHKTEYSLQTIHSVLEMVVCYEITGREI